MPKRKDISNDLTEAIVAINLRRGHFQTILSPLFYSNEDNSQVENIQDNCQSVDIPANLPQGQTVYCSEKLQKTQ